jgi:DNA replication protein DnaC
MKDLGLADPDSKPEPVRCGDCGEPSPYTWIPHITFGHWTRDECEACEKKRLVDQARERDRSALEKAGVPREFWGHRLGHPVNKDEHNEKAYDAVFTWKQPAWLLFVGTVGTGKTSLVTSLLNSLLTGESLWRGSRWTTEASIFERADIAHDNGGYTARQAVVAPLIRAPLLVIDDIGASRRSLTEWQGSAMRNLFDWRYSNGMPTFMTSNITNHAALASRYGDHIYSRIVSATGGPLTLGGPDRRKRGS